MIVCEPKSAYRARLDGDWEAIKRELADLSSIEALNEWEADFFNGRARVSPWWLLVAELANDRRAELELAEAEAAMDAEVGRIFREG